MNEIFPALPRKPQTRQLCALQAPVQSRQKVSDPRRTSTPRRQSNLQDPRSSMIHLVAAQPSIAREPLEHDLEQSPLDRLLPYIEKPSGIGIEKPTPLQPAYDEAEERLRIGVEATYMFYFDDGLLEQLEALLDGYRKSDERTASGASKLSLAYERFIQKSTRIQPTETYLNQQLAKLDKWQKEQPDALSPKLIRALVLREYAYATLNDTNLLNRQELRQLFLKRLEQEVAYLDAIKPEVAKRDPYWYVLMLEARGAQRAPKAELFTLLDEASKTFPNELHIYLKAAGSIATNSISPIDDVESVAILAAVRAESQGASAYYARTYWYIINRIVGAQNIGLLKIDWGRFAEGANAIIAKYPVQWNIQHFAAFLCFGGDAKTVHQLFKSIEGRPIRQAWGDFAIHDKCRDWAADPVNQYGKNKVPLEQ